MTLHLKLLNAKGGKEEMFKHDFEYILDSSDMSDIYGGWISDKDKVRRLAESDRTTPEKVIKDIIVGMIGECGAYHWVSQYYKCEYPNFGIMERDAEIWTKDLMALEDIRIKTATGNIQTVLRSVSCKSQFYSLTEGIGDVEPSWTFQLKIKGRFPDPMLSDPNCNKLLVVSWVDDHWDGSNVNHSNPRKAYREYGFRWKPKMSCFWWPDVFPYLAEPRMKKLIGMKKALYYQDIKHLRAELLSK